jgi:hypothetical protein
MHDPDEEANHMSNLPLTLREARVVGLPRVSKQASSCNLNPSAR